MSPVFYKVTCRGEPLCSPSLDSLIKSGNNKRSELIKGVDSLSVSDFIAMGDKKTTLTIQIQPRAKRNEVLGFVDGILKLKIAAPPIEGKANKEVINYLSDVLDIPKSSIDLEHGHTGKIKVIAINGLNREQIYKRIDEAKIRRERN